MSEPVTKFWICAAADGVVLNPVGRHNRAHESLQLSYGNGRIVRSPREEDAVAKLQFCEAFGIIGISACFLALQATRADPTQVYLTWWLAPS